MAVGFFSNDFFKKISCDGGGSGEAIKPCYAELFINDSFAKKSEKGAKKRLKQKNNL